MTFYRRLFTVTGVFLVLVGAGLLFIPWVYLWLYVPVYDPAMDFPAERLSPGIMGLGALLLLLRDLPPGPLPVRVARLGAVIWVGVAATGVFHFATGLASWTILLAVFTEVVLAALFLIAARRMQTP